MAEGSVIVILTSLLALLVLVGIIANAWNSHEKRRQCRRDGHLPNR